MARSGDIIVRFARTRYLALVFFPESAPRPPASAGRPRCGACADRASAKLVKRWNAATTSSLRSGGALLGQNRSSSVAFHFWLNPMPAGVSQGVSDLGAAGVARTGAADASGGATSGCGRMGFAGRRMGCGWVAAAGDGSFFGFTADWVTFGLADATDGSGVAAGVLDEVLRSIRGGATGSEGSTVPVRWAVLSRAVSGRAATAWVAAPRSASTSGPALRRATFWGAAFAPAVRVGLSGVGVTRAGWASRPTGPGGGVDSGWTGGVVTGIAGVAGVESTTEGAAGAG